MKIFQTIQWKQVGLGAVSMATFLVLLQAYAVGRYESWVLGAMLFVLVFASLVYVRLTIRWSNFGIEFAIGALVAGFLLLPLAEQFRTWLERIWTQ